MSIYLIVIAIILMIWLSAFFSGSEMALSSCNLLRMQNLRDEGSRRAAVAVRILENFDYALSAILIGNNLVNIGASALVSVLVILLSGSDKLTWIGTAILTVVIIIFGETIPKICAKKSANRLTLRIAYPIRALTVLLTPVIWVVVGLNWLLTFWMKEEKDENGEEAVEELHSIIETAEDEKVLDEDQSELVRSAIDFSEISAMDVMTARVDVVAIDIEDSWEEILAQIEKANFSRMPVYEGSIDNIIGVLYLNRFLKAVAEEGKADIRSLLMPPCYVYKTMKLPAVLNQLRRAKQHLAIVTDEYGGTLGVLSMEDVLEQIVGDIWDDNDEVEPEVVERKEGEYELDGAMMLFEMEELLGLPEESIEAESNTVGGWTIECFGGFPQVGDSFEKDGLKVTVLEMSDGRRVDKVLVKRVSEDEKKE
ncbi:MAG: HlyC/CorC family transporter [Oscillospiraceae bacterium]|nr:HlyC/CorC family transporter [Oscillospiraceae bacterium]MBQ6927438.1 HlyC/CorC family transporter [Oscillospiraceae bacterium]